MSFRRRLTSGWRNRERASCWVIVLAPCGRLAADDPGQVVPEGPEDAPDVDARVAEEAVVLGGDDGLDEDIGDVGEGDLDAALLGELLDGPAVGGVDRRDELGLHRLELGDRGEVVLDGHVGPEEPAQDGRRAGEEEEKEDADEVRASGVFGS